MNSNRRRTGSYQRETKETNVSVEVVLDGKGRYKVSTGVAMLDHLLEEWALHGRFDLNATATAYKDPDRHHLIEDIAICLGRALDNALEDRNGIKRMGHAIIPMDEALALVAVDISGRGYAVTDLPFSSDSIGDLPSQLVSHFLETLAREAKLNLHASLMKGDNDHHKAEALFKALGRALDEASNYDDRLEGETPSSKGTIG